MEFPKINLHSHTSFSDGNNSIKKIVFKSLKLGLKYIAITDHFTNSWKANLISSLNSEEKIDIYLSEITECQKYIKINNIELCIYKGIEIDAGSSANFIKRLICPEKFDIILFEYIDNPEGIAFVKSIIEYWKKSMSPNNTLPLLGLAHFDPSNFVFGGLDILIDFLKEAKIYFEFNSRYPEYQKIKRI